MYKIRKTGYVIGGIRCHQRLEKKRPVTYESRLWKIWRATITQWTCYYCASMDGCILSEDDSRLWNIPVHPHCRCRIEPLFTIAAGTATNAGRDGVDLYVARYGKLPNYYLTQKEAKKAGWKKLLGNLDEVLPGRMIGGDVFANHTHKLPESLGRIWYEADFDYNGGYRNNCRLLYSNDGLLFVTYDHYMSFYEIGREDQI